MFCCHLNVFGCEFTSLVSDHELNGSLYESFCLHLDVESQVLSSLMLKVVASTLAFDDSCDESNAVHVLICRLQIVILTVKSYPRSNPIHNQFVKITMELRPRTRSTQTDLQPLIFKKKAVKPLPKTQEYRQDESIVLLSKKTMKRFRVFLDEEWGFPSSYNSYIHETNYDDEDYDSSDQIIECGLKKCLRLLEKTVTQKTKQTGDSQETDTEFESIDQCKKSTLMSLYYPESELSKTSK